MIRVRVPAWVLLFAAVPVIALALSSDADFARQVFARAALGLIGCYLLCAAWVAYRRGER